MNTNVEMSNYSIIQQINVKNQKFAYLLNS